MHEHWSLISLPQAIGTTVAWMKETCYLPVRRPFFLPRNRELPLLTRTLRNLHRSYVHWRRTLRRFAGYAGNGGRLAVQLDAEQQIRSCFGWLCTEQYSPAAVRRQLRAE